MWDILPHQYLTVEVSGTVFHMVGNDIRVPTTATIVALIPTWDNNKTPMLDPITGQSRDRSYPAAPHPTDPRLVRRIVGASAPRSFPGAGGHDRSEKRACGMSRRSGLVESRVHGPRGRWRSERHTQCGSRLYTAKPAT